MESGHRQTAGFRSTYRADAGLSAGSRPTSGATDIIPDFEPNIRVSVSSATGQSIRRNKVVRICIQYVHLTLFSRNSNFQPSRLSFKNVKKDQVYREAIPFVFYTRFLVIHLFAAAIDHSEGIQKSHWDFFENLHWNFLKSCIGIFRKTTLGYLKSCTGIF